MPPHYLRIADIADKLANRYYASIASLYFRRIGYFRHYAMPLAFWLL
jgi:hypothetical protein